MSQPDLEQVRERMRADWNARAAEDANYYVAFGRRAQSREEFLATASDLVKGLVRDLRYLPPAPPSCRRALEIGCGPGRLMLPLSRWFGEIHGVDVSDEMIALARKNLQGIAHAHVHVGSGSDLPQFADQSFDFVYSYAVFQHIPSHDVIWSYLREAGRVLKPGAILRCQVNGLWKRPGEESTTWNGASFTPVMLREFAREQGLQLLSIEGAGTQYLWMTLRRPAPGAPAPARAAAIRRVTNASSSEPCVPASGRFAALSLWVENLPPQADLERLSVLVRGRAAEVTFIGPPERDGLTQVNAMLPAGLASGYAPVEIVLDGEPLGASGQIRILPPPPAVPAVVSVTDGIDLCAGTTITTGTLKMIVDETREIESLQAFVNGQPLLDLEFFLIAPQIPRFEVNGRLPPDFPAGPARLEISVGRRRFPPMEVVVDPGRK